MRKIFTKYMFLLLICLFAFGYILAYSFGNEQSYSINKTVGWAYDISNQVLLAALFTLSQLVFIIGYLIIFLLQRKTNYYISVAHFEIIILGLASMSFENLIVKLGFGVLSVILFFINVFKSHK